MFAVPTEVIDRFRAFVRRARDLAPPPPCDQFRAFVAAATDCLAGDLLPRVRRHRPELQRLAEWLVEDRFDILAVAGFRWVEDAYSDLIAWSLSPDVHPESALARQKAWLTRVGVPEAAGFTALATPQTRVWTDDGIPDLYLQFSELLVVVEAKTGTGEHETPSGLPQTTAYAAALRRHLGLTDCAVRTLFLTPDGADPADPAAIPTTYADFVYAVVLAFRPADFPPAFAHSLRIVLTHLLNHAGSEPWKHAELIHQLVRLAESGGGASELVPLAARAYQVLDGLIGGDRDGTV